MNTANVKVVKRSAIAEHLVKTINVQKFMMILNLKY